MGKIRIDGVSKRFGKVEVLSDLSLSIHNGEFIVFLGPSGCGKSTLLRMIAGLETVDEGKIYLGDNRIDTLAPGARQVAMVFQHYALYPHMTVFDNVAFGLRNIGLSENEIAERIDDASSMLEIGDLLIRKPGQLSGGQRQRVAIARALVKRPSAYLFDEPLSNLDAALRLRTRVELARLHQQVRATTIFVTHDQIEAMTLAERIVVMNKRVIEQVGTPIEIYNQPRTEFVARFVGSPAMNIVDADISRSGSKLAAVLPGGARVDLPASMATASLERQCRFGIRPESVTIGKSGRIAGAVEVVEHLGDRTHLHVRIAPDTVLVAEDNGLSQVRVGEKVNLELDASRAHLFDGDGLAYQADASEPADVA